MENSEFKQIGQRLRGLREVLNIPLTQMAEVCETTVEHYLKIEEGACDPSVYRLNKVSKRYGIALDVLLFGSEPRMQSYFVTRKGQASKIERRGDYEYHSLASGFKNRTVEAFYTEISPLPDNRNHAKNSREGQELDYVLEGRLEITIDDKVLILNEGDSIYFDTSRPHCMRALDGKVVKFLCVII